MRLMDEFADHDVLGPPIRASWERGYREGQRLGRLDIVNWMLTHRFGSLDPEILARLDVLTMPELKAMAFSCIGSASFDELFLEVTA